MKTFIQTTSCPRGTCGARLSGFGEHETPSRLAAAANITGRSHHLGNIRARSLTCASTRPGYGNAIAPTDDLIQIRSFSDDDLDTIVEFSLRAWAPVFASVQEVLGDDIFLRLHPDWKATQAAAVRSSCTSRDRDVFVALVDERPVGFVTVALNAFHERMGVIDIIGVDPEFQRRGVGSRLTAVAVDHMRRQGMDIAVVETGGDPGHAPARAAYDEAGFTLLPISRYFRVLS